MKSIKIDRFNYRTFRFKENMTFKDGKCLFSAQEVDQVNYSVKDFELVGLKSELLIDGRKIFMH